MFATRSSSAADRTAVEDRGEDVNAGTSVIGGVPTVYVAFTRAVSG